LRAYFVERLASAEAARRFGYSPGAFRVLYRRTARRMRGYDDAQARQIFRDLVDMPADVAVKPAEVKVRFHRRAHLPIVLASGLIDKPVAVPWWQGRSLRLVQ
jgi:hypothetical protein